MVAHTHGALNNRENWDSKGLHSHIHECSCITGNATNQLVFLELEVETGEIDR